MRKKMIWGLAILIILLIGVSVFLLIQTPETEPENVYKPPTPEDDAQVQRIIQDGTEKSKSNLSPIAEVEVDKPAVAKEKPQVKETPAVKGASGRVGSDYPLLIETENPVIGKGIPLRTVDGTGIDIDWESLSPSELAEKIKQAEREALLTPERYNEGYYYRRFSDGSLLLDERGFPILHKIHEPFISVIWTMKFKPSSEQLVKYDELHQRRNRLGTRAPSSPELAAAQAELDEFVSTHVGPLPVSFQSSLSVPDEQLEATEAREREIIRELKAEIFRQLDLEYLLDLY